MEKLEFFDKVNLNQIRKIVQSYLDEAGEECGLHIKMGNIRFSEHEFSCPIAVNIIDKPSKAERDYSEAYPWLKLPKIGYQFQTRGGDRYEVVMHKPSAPKFNLVAKDILTGKKYKFVAEEVNRLNRPVQA